MILSSHIVSDIDAIADEVAIMKNGSLITKGEPENIVKKVEGKVLETTIEKEQLSSFKNNHIVVSTKRKQGKLQVRYISENPTEDSILQEANLEDAYLYLTKTN